MRRLPLPELALVAMTVIWGLSFVSIKWALDDAGPLALTGWRNLVGLAVILMIRPRALAATAIEWRAGLLGGGLLAVGYVLETAGMQTAGAARSGFLAQFYVALVPFLEAATFRRRPVLADVACLVLATAGIGVMVVRPGQEVSLGEVLVALAALAWTVQIVLVGRVAERVDPVRIGAIQIGVIGVAGFLSLAVAPEPAVRWTSSFVANTVFLGVLASAVGFLVQAWAQKTVNPTRTAVLFAGQPIFALAFAVALLGESFDGRDVAGSLLIMAAIALAVVAPRRASAVSPHAAEAAPR